MTIVELREDLEFLNAYWFWGEDVQFEDPPSATASTNTSGHKRKPSSDNTPDNASGRSNRQELNDVLSIGKSKPSLYTPGEDLWKMASIPALENSIYSCLVVSPAGRVVSDFNTVKEPLESMRDGIRAHRSLYVTGKILHRDIS
ncbi:Uncharacterized protein TCAP_05006 [Tolypocladium capitatum]|uniref:Fungal-type protein kinase domain-containing protein n=1 Tax=Tolypocladium capitatum TaxID=45235 RepID=A0A2K3QC24_9HYPO|nr:Uncharacterized protein TCAP_05006 [Tolypocladium capitatum]